MCVCVQKERERYSLNVYLNVVCECVLVCLYIKRERGLICIPSLYVLFVFVCVYVCERESFLCVIERDI